MIISLSKKIFNILNIETFDSKTKQIYIFQVYSSIFKNTTTKVINNNNNKREIEAVSTYYKIKLSEHFIVKRA